MKAVHLLIPFLGLAMPAFAYQTGTVNRTNFGPGPQQPSRQQFRSFSNYNNRSWGQGVQTRGVQTHVAGADVAEFEPPAAQKPAPVAKQQATDAAKPAAAGSPAPAPAAPQTDAKNPQAPANMDPAAMMQQVQGMMNMMSGMANPAAGQPAGQPSGQAAPAAANAAAAMPGGMPDLSALMGGMMPAQPQAAPAKK